MIHPEDFLIEATKLFKHFGKDIQSIDLPDLEEIFAEELNTIEFKQACKNAKREFPSHPSFFPSPRWMIDSVLGTIDERGINELDNLDRLSIIGRKALEAIGGAWAFSKSERPEMLKKDFLLAYKAFAKTAKPIAPNNEYPLGLSVADQLRLREPARAIAPAVESIKTPAPDLTAPPEPMTLANKVSILNAKLKLKNLRKKAIEEAMALGLGITQDEIFLPPDMEGNQLLENMTLDVSNLLRDFYAGKQITNTEVEQEIGF